MSNDANLTWNFVAKSEVTNVALRTQLYAPVDAKVEALKQELETYGYKDPQLTHVCWEKWAWPGGYPLYYICKDGGVLCADCANDNIKLTSAPDADDQWTIVARDINWEDAGLTCDHCNKAVGSAYADEINEDFSSAEGDL